MIADELEALYTAATPGPWQAGELIPGAGDKSDECEIGTDTYFTPSDGPMVAGAVWSDSATADAALIVALLNAVPQLISALRVAEYDQGSRIYEIRDGR